MADYKVYAVCWHYIYRVPSYYYMTNWYTYIYVRVYCIAQYSTSLHIVNKAIIIK